MGNINLSFGNNTPKTVKSKKEKIVLTYHEPVEGISEYYSYIDENGNEVKFDDKSYTIVKLSANKYIAKKANVSKVNLKYVPAQESSEYEPEYFTYGDEKYLGEVKYNEETGKHTGIINVVKTYDKEIKLYEEI